MHIAFLPFKHASAITRYPKVSFLLHIYILRREQKSSVHLYLLLTFYYKPSYILSGIELEIDICI